MSDTLSTAQTGCQVEYQLRAVCSPSAPLPPFVKGEERELYILPPTLSVDFWLWHNRIVFQSMKVRLA